MMTKTYLGDGVYVEYDNLRNDLTLTTDSGYGKHGPASTIHLTPEVYHALLEFVARMESRSVEEPPQ